MIVTHLKLGNVRAIETATFSFRPGFNLLVGVNGVGKTTTLAALGVCLSAIVSRANGLRSPLARFHLDDVRSGSRALTVECGVEIGGEAFTYLFHKPRTPYTVRKAKVPSDEVLSTPEWKDFVGASPTLARAEKTCDVPLAAMFSTRRAVPSAQVPRKGRAAGGLAAAVSDAFVARELRIGEFARWMHVQQRIATENPKAIPMLRALALAVDRFLPGYENLRVVIERDRPNLVIDHGAVTLPVRDLSDGERGALALVLDLTRRLAQANPSRKDPAREARAVVLIDELELHLHPQWQRTIVGNLEVTFPNVQFIATTHSPQVIGQVQHDRVQIMGRGHVYSPAHSFGVDSSRVLEEIMGTAPRALAVQGLLEGLSKEISRKRFRKARAIVADLAKELGETDAEVIRARTMLDFLGED